MKGVVTACPDRHKRQHFPGSWNCFSVCRPRRNTAMDNRSCMLGRMSAVHMQLVPAFDKALLLV